ncbi:uncharacterized protein METZ01_LOCUS232671 [marine metagenome]|uniref:Uncharacterized protein n=1 Tax=marine metagenome TaxID=408172 RepID=A0A382GYN6_9ZZZZ
MNYFTTIEQYFLSLKGSGLTLSASDYQLIDEWESRNVPVGLVCRAIKTSYSRFGETSSKRSRTSLVQIQALIEQEIREEMHRQ